MWWMVILYYSIRKWHSLVELFYPISTTNVDSPVDRAISIYFLSKISNFTGPYVITAVPVHYGSELYKHIKTKHYCNLHLQQTSHIRRLTNIRVPFKLRYLSCQPVPDRKPSKTARDWGGHIPGVKGLDTDGGAWVDDLGLLFDVEFVVVETVTDFAGLLGDPGYELHLMGLVWFAIYYIDFLYKWGQKYYSAISYGNKRKLIIGIISGLEYDWW